jgi:hypothetical protein
MIFQNAKMVADGDELTTADSNLRSITSASGSLQFEGQAVR